MRAESDWQASRTGHSQLNTREARAIKTFMLNLVTESFSIATVQRAGRSAVTIAIDPEHHWNAEGLRMLAAAFKGVAGVLEKELTDFAVESRACKLAKGSSKNAHRATSGGMGGRMVARSIRQGGVQLKGQAYKAGTDK